MMVESPGWLDLCADLDPATSIDGDSLLAFLFRGLNIPSHAMIRAATLMFVAQTSNTSHSGDEQTVEVSHNHLTVCYTVHNVQNSYTPFPAG